MDKSKRSQFWFYFVLVSILAVCVFLHLSFALDIEGLNGIWRNISYIVEIAAGFVGFTAAFFFATVAARMKVRGAERSILILITLTSIFFGAALILVGVMFKFAGDETLTHSFLTPGNLAPLGSFLAASIAAVIAILILIRNSYLIMSRSQLLTTVIISLLVLGSFIALFFTSLLGIELSGVVKIASLFLAVVCIFSSVGMVFALIAFGKGRGGVFWRDLSLGILFLAVSGLGFFLCLAFKADHWKGLPILGFAAGISLMAHSGYRRWRVLQTRS
ncbi:hypothetical protein GF359_05495 [candidate division WOR-3 bacterium]|uniref:Uncharacterized protein n=1 Tax=candidate division WOR-3 bacterium TaxID=2052148 RepID=A0A9D5QE30_UNCW3|nr:hypothetical protein [candidate division WOR-3 bacterium]MBD3364650.1 hypothetical protein [candidate division WOR-3 bacterium]